MYNITEKITRVSYTEICSTYNSYFIKGDKTAVIDIMPSDEMNYINALAKADYIILTHTDPKCANVLRSALEQNSSAVVVATAATIRNYKEILNCSFNERCIKNEQIIDLGGETIKFFITPNLNQPDTMIVFENENEILFSGLLYSSFDTDDGEEWFYNEYLSMYREYVVAAENTAAVLTPSRVCPYIGTEYGGTEDYTYKPEKKDGISASVYFSSVYGSTKKMAYALADGLRAGGIRTMVFDADNDGWDEMNASLDADILLFGSLTIHRNASGTMWRLISGIDAVSAPKKTALAFGSYGWSGEGARVIEKLLKALKIKIYASPKTAVYVPTDEELRELRSFAEKMASDIKHVG